MEIVNPQDIARDRFPRLISGDGRGKERFPPQSVPVPQAAVIVKITPLVRPRRVFWRFPPRFYFLQPTLGAKPKPAADQGRRPRLAAAQAQPQGGHGYVEFTTKEEGEHQRSPSPPEGAPPAQGGGAGRGGAQGGRREPGGGRRARGRRRPRARSLVPGRRARGGKENFIYLIIGHYFVRVICSIQF